MNVLSFKVNLQTTTHMLLLFAASLTERVSVEKIPIVLVLTSSWCSWNYLFTSRKDAMKRNNRSHQKLLNFEQAAVCLSAADTHTRDTHRWSLSMKSQSAGSIHEVCALCGEKKVTSESKKLWIFFWRWTILLSFSLLSAFSVNS